VAVRLEQLPPELHDRAGSLELKEEAIEAVLAGLLERLERWTSASAESVLDAVRARDVLLDRQVRWAGGSGRAAGIDGSGRLVVVTPQGRIELDAGEVHLV
jgi:biotin-(acetyl-CoA carboxylase) ligase